MRRNRRPKFKYVRPSIGRSLEERRTVFSEVRQEWAKFLDKTNAEINALVSEKLPKGSKNSLLWANALLDLEVKCPVCNGTGTYPLRNGSLGKCYACGCKGTVTHRDVKRNANYWAEREKAQASRQQKEPARIRPKAGTPKKLSQMVELTINGEKVKISEAKLTELLVNTLSA